MTGRRKLHRSSMCFGSASESLISLEEQNIVGLRHRKKGTGDLPRYRVACNVRFVGMNDWGFEGIIDDYQLSKNLFSGTKLQKH